MVEIKTLESKILLFLERFTGGFLFKLGFTGKWFLPVHYKLRSFNTRMAIKRIRGKTPCNINMEIFNSAIKQIKEMQKKDKLAGIGNG